MSKHTLYVLYYTHNDEMDNETEIMGKSEYEGQMIDLERQLREEDSLFGLEIKPVEFKL